MRFTIKGPYSAKEVCNRPDVKKRLKQLTNGGWGRHTSTLYHIVDNLTPKEKCKFWFAWHEGEIVGWIWRSEITKAQYLKKPKRADIHTFVHHKFRKKGIGKRLLSALVAGTPKNVHFLEEAWNQAGINLYKRLEDENKNY